MNAGKNICHLLLAERMKRWHDLVRTPLIDRKVPPAYARRQFRNLLRKHPLVADPASVPTGLGLSQHLSPSSPVASAPPQEFLGGSLNADVSDSAPAERLVDQIAGCQQEPSASGVQPISLEGEVL